ncbi:hypothetical protein BDN72DRAFT_906638 [Pluteus cervinus]|uniref:Uncharacterized protein n=1 Tax=Pluteus cervinus TaxID=181527 RepID=A0ACD2ZYB0_9AGAR|nr:hypothetical protein BDN72DRAFT_906638 [Pluteus cervinus]
MKGILDVFTACILVEIGNVLHSGFWNNSLKDSERVEIIEGRRLSRCLVTWLGQAVVNIKVSPGKVKRVKLEQDIYVRYLASQLRAFHQDLQKHAKPRQEIELWNHEDLLSKLKDMYPPSRHAAFWGEWNALDTSKTLSYAPPFNCEDYAVLSVPQGPIEFDQSIDGLTALDEEWLKHLNLTRSSLFPPELQFEMA